MDEIGIIYLTMCSVILFIAIMELNAFGGVIITDFAIVIIAIGFVALAMLNWVDFIVFPIITKLFGISFRISKEYKVTNTQDSVIKEVNGLYYAIGFLTANFFNYEIKVDSGQVEGQDTESRIIEAPMQWERAIMSIDFPFKFHILSFGRDVQQERENLIGKKSYKEFQLAQMLQSNKTTDVAVADLQRKIESIDDRIRRISQGEKPIATIMYFESIAVGVSEKAAIDNLAVQLNRLQIAMGNMNLNIRRVVGRDLYALINFNFSLPESYKIASGYFDIEGG
ncbi:MAG: hypothetical protein QXD11_00435 [Candidatus Micrarchaeaceae archaeon]